MWKVKQAKELLKRFMKGIEGQDGQRLAGEGHGCQGNCKAFGWTVGWGRGTVLASL